MGSKQFKDPVYGYISIPDDLCSDIVDTPGFQRLRRISQTGYAPLYPSALHNRFVHSLGVYHLSGIAAESLGRSAERILTDASQVERWKDALATFRLACLLHDFGHAPFSHAGEDFYLQADVELEDRLIQAVSDDIFKADVEERPESYQAAPHEIMSALLSIEEFESRIGDKALFARCILGYKYLHPVDEIEKLENVLTETLHSETIDVDRLDYLIRDSFVVGYDSVVIDYRRLLSGLRIVDENGRYERCFYRSSLSVLQNVIYARDLEKQWIQAHPVILYEQDLVRRLITEVNEAARREHVDLFSADALTQEGVSLPPVGRVRLMSDDDFVFLAKQLMDDSPTIREYFDRGARRHPLWKSEAQFKMLFEVRLDREQESLSREMRDTISALMDFFDEKKSITALDDGAIEAVESDMVALGRETGPRWRTSGEARKRQLRLLNAVKSFSEENGVAFDYVVLRTKSFSSGFSAGDIGNLKIVFSDEPRALSYSFKEISAGLKADRPLSEPFYVFHKRGEGVSIDPESFADCLIGAMRQ